ncbi:glycosyltransferase, partial [Candidatus Bipolaricaulota bacterium]|nr:glycosyltransferase [Candidatus Bipolaricaulota bacterium]
MKILIVSPYFYPKTGGLENYAFNIIKKLKEHHNITILCSSINKDSIESFKGMKIIRFKPSHILSNTPIRYNLIIKISEVLREGDFDIVNAHTPVPFYADMAAIASKKNNTP